MEELNEYGYRKITSEEMYNEEYKKWKKKLNQITFNKLRKDPEYYLKEFQRIMQEGAERELISFDFAEEKVKRMHNEMSAPQRFQMDMEEKKNYIKRKAREYFKKDKDK